MINAIFLFICMVFVTFIVVIFTLLSGEIYYIGLIVVVACILYLLFVFLMSHFFKTKKRKRVFISISIIAIIIASIQPIYRAYDSSKIIGNMEVDIYQYIPFSENGRIATLEEESSFKVTDDLPKIDGATALYPLYSAFVQATFPKKDYDPYFSEVMVNQTPNAYEKLFNGEVDMIFVAAPSDSQKKVAKNKGLELEMTPIGREAFVFFVNQKNQINGLTIDQIKDIYSGKVKNWEDVGGKNDSIRAFQRPEDSGSQSALQRLMGDKAIMEAPTENVASGMGDIIEEVANYRNYDNAIGYTFRFYVKEMVKNDQIKLLEIDGIAPTKETIQNGTYPLSTEFYIVTAGTDNPNVEPFIEWILSSQGQEILEKTGFVPVR